MQILQLVSTRGVSGAAIYAQRLTRLLLDHGHTVFLAAPRGSWISRQFEGEALWLPTDFVSDRAGLENVAAFCAQYGIHLTHSHATRSHAFGHRLARRTGGVHIAHAHSHHLNLHWFFQRHIIALTASAARQLRRTYLRRSGHVAILPNFVEASRFTPPPPEESPLHRELHLTSEQRVVLCPAKVLPRKGQLTLVQAFAGVLPRHPDLRLVLAGQDDSHPRYTRRVRREIQRLGVADRVTLTGFRPDLPRLLPHAHHIVLPSLAEPFALGGLEAMACGLPLIATRVGGFTDMIVDGVNGLLVPPADPAALADAMDRVLRSSTLHAQLGRNARQHVIHHFSGERHLRDFEQIVARWTLEPFGPHSDRLRLNPR